MPVKFEQAPNATMRARPGVNRAARMLKIGRTLAVPPKAPMYPVSPDALNRSRLSPLAPPKLAPDFRLSAGIRENTQIPMIQ